MKRIALTGGIATGKSYVATRLREVGLPVVDADVLSREVVAPGTPGLAAIRGRFGPAVIAADGTLDRKRVAEIVFSNATARQDLEAIIHPAVWAGIEAFFEGLPADMPFAVADIPLLFETGRESQFDVVIVAACPRELQLERVMARDAASRDDAERRIAAQWPIEDKVAGADYVVSTGISAEETDRQVTHLVHVLRRAFG